MGKDKRSSGEKQIHQIHQISQIHQICQICHIYQICQIIQIKKRYVLALSLLDGL
jgi:hypothetical protein